VVEVVGGAVVEGVVVVDVECKSYITDKIRL
jgi:hypothetical protein